MANQDYERAAAGAGLVAGIDEVGRGPLAGPVVAAAVILDPDGTPEGLDDSKKLTARRREILFEEIMARARAVALGQASAAEIDALNIRRATHLAMVRAAAALASPAGFFLIDGRETPDGLPAPAQAIVKGDSASVSIAAASIVAKVLRDRQMARAARLFPAYGFDSHAGYPTAAHLAALNRHGPCPLHRRTFAPVRAILSAAPARAFTRP